MASPISQVGILIVDDDREICDYMETFLTRDGFFVKTITVPQDAVEETIPSRYPGFDDAQDGRHRAARPNPENRQRHRGDHLHGVPVAGDRGGFPEVGCRRLYQEALQPG